MDDTYPFLGESLLFSILLFNMPFEENILREKDELSFGINSSIFPSVVFILEEAKGTCFKNIDTKAVFVFISK